MASLLHTIRRFWSSLTRQSSAPAPEVVIHDPEAEGARDLDDPFLDQEVQKKMAQVIANAAQKK